MSGDAVLWNGGNLTSGSGINQAEGVVAFVGDQQQAGRG
jgi:hypothetical protein